LDYLLTHTLIERGADHIDALNECV
jgi:hypothetical protein